MKRSLFFRLIGMATLHMALPFFVDAGIAQDNLKSLVPLPLAEWVRLSRS